MRLKILLPFGLFLERADVTRIVTTTRFGSFGLLPHRLDCAGALSPGILSYSTQMLGEVHVAIDEGVLVKTGADVLVCVRHAVGGADLGNLRNTVEREFLKLDEREKSVRSTLAQLESGFIRRFAELKRA